MCYHQHLQPAVATTMMKLLVFSCILIGLSHGHRQRGGGRGRDDVETAVDDVTGTAVCPKRVIKHLDGCCSIPALIPQDILNACFYSERGWGTVSSTTPATRQAGEAPLPEGGADDAPAASDGAATENMPMRVAERLTQGDDSSSDSDSNDDDGVRVFLDFAAFGFGGRGRGNGGQKIGACVVDCAFQKMKLIGSDGKLDVAAIKNKFADSPSVNDEWRPIVNEAITNCTARVEGANLTTYGPAINVVGRNCSLAPDLLRRCIRHYLAVNNRNRGVVLGFGFGRGGFGGQFFNGQQEVEGQMGRGRRRNRNKHGDTE
ncbi:hypothetical protein B566_EDAN010729 [Ephemera danica]|nr:hypothetical protein B566_EDAN010729 [Ephemera danica]